MAKGSINKVMILGRLGQDPEVRATQSGMQVATLSVATTELGRKDPNTGQRAQDETEWNRCVLFGRNAENAATYLKKGSQVYLEGRLRTNKWQDQNGNDRYTTEIICNEMQFIGGGQGQAGNQGQYQGQSNNQYQPTQTASNNFQQSAPQSYQPAPAQPQAPSQPSPSAPQPAQSNGFDDFDDDIPF